MYVLCIGHVLVLYGVDLAVYQTNPIESPNLEKNSMRPYHLAHCSVSCCSGVFRFVCYFLGFVILLLAIFHESHLSILHTSLRDACLLKFRVLAQCSKHRPKVFKVFPFLNLPTCKLISYTFLLNHVESDPMNPLELQFVETLPTACTGTPSAVSTNHGWEH